MKKIKDKTNAMLRLEREYNTSIEELLRKLYIDEEKTIEEISEELLLAPGTTFKWLKLAGIRTRKMKFE